MSREKTGVEATLCSRPDHLFDARDLLLHSREQETAHQLRNHLLSAPRVQPDPVRREAASVRGVKAVRGKLPQPAKPRAG